MGSSTISKFCTTNKSGFGTWYFWLCGYICPSIMCACMHNPACSLPDSLKSKKINLPATLICEHEHLERWPERKVVLWVRLWLLGIYVLRECMQMCRSLTLLCGRMSTVVCAGSYVRTCGCVCMRVCVISTHCDFGIVSAVGTVYVWRAFSVGGSRCS